MRPIIYRFGLRGRDVHVVGHSLGAHLVGKIATLFQEETGQKVARVTGTGYRVQVPVPGTIYIQGTVYNARTGYRVHCTYRVQGTMHIQGTGYNVCTRYRGQVVNKLQQPLGAHLLLTLCLNFNLLSFSDKGLFINDIINFGGYRDPTPLPLVIIRHFLATPPSSRDKTDFATKHRMLGS